MSTFIGQLIGFAVIVWLVVKYVVPPVRTMMQKQQDAVRAALAESASAAQKLESADEEHAKAVEDARTEAPGSPRRRAATLTGSPSIDASRPRPTPSASRRRAHSRFNLLHQQNIRELRPTSVPSPCRRPPIWCAAHVADPAAQSATVDRFLDELDEMAPSPAVLEAGATLNLRAASRDALAELVSKFDRWPTDSTPTD